MREEKGKQFGCIKSDFHFRVAPVVLPVGGSREELAERWQGPEGVLERAAGWEPEPAVEKKIQRKPDRKMDREEEMRCCRI